MKTWTGRILPAVVAALCLAAAGCSSDSKTPSHASSDGKTTTGDSSAFPVTIDSAVGKATIPARPERVVTIGWGSQDAALALGVTPVGMQDMSGDTGDKTGILPWDAPKLHGAEPTLLKYATGEVPYEQIAALRPDVILAVDSGLTGAQYQQLSRIAPTVGYPGKPWLTSWQDQLRLVGKALGMSTEAAALEKSTDKLIADAKARHPEFTGKTVAFGSGTTTSSYNLYLSSDTRVQLLHQLGFTVSPSLPSSAKSFAAQLSLEKLDSIDSDVLVSWYLSKPVQQQLEANTLFRRMPAVERGGYVPLTDPAMVYATSAVSVLSLPWMLDRYLPLLSTAAKGKTS
ncbi:MULTISPECIES: iron-siderophore ABC transporter substrate-binding protein [unclassified Streptomyces]|uniref:iron-siderophore ABC transporter substrate-binding protein n=1 Tax=unclassified Streptomyces TaxID=2593676 RepID=UPI00044D15D1|nr:MULTISPECIES: iron-siderophore ABC transporter substrate-binding protein [unclassified Streptomyces]EYT81164.1 iron siderophore-binding protein [Streptomyces sp. Tu 6176]